MQHYPEKKKKNTPANQRYFLTAAIAITTFIAGFVLGALMFMNTAPPGRPYPTTYFYPSPTPIAYIDIVIALQNIPCGYVIPESAVGLVPYPVEVMPAASLYDVESVVGKLARTDIYREMPVLENVLTDNPDEVSSTCEN